MDTKHTILFVDDEQNILSSLKRLFRREGYSILTAPGGAEGLELIKENQVSLVISDQRMPQMIGAEFLAKAKEIAPNCMRIMLTGFSDIEAATQAINEGGIYRYVTKPWDDEDLKQVVRDALGRLELESENRRLTEELQTKNVELEAFNTRLEQKVKERTHELQLKVRELEGRDRIAQHMLAIHTLEETLEVVLEVATETMELDTAIIHLKQEDGFVPTARVGGDTPGSQEGKEQLTQVAISKIHERAYEVVEQRLEPVNVKNPEGPVPPFAVVPILRGDELLGILEADNHRSQRPISDVELASLASLAIQAAIAISDSQSHQDMGRWKSELDDVLKSVDELDDITNG